MPLELELLVFVGCLTWLLNSDPLEEQYVLVTLSSLSFQHLSKL